MNLTIRQITAAAMLVAMGSAQAASVTVLSGDVYKGVSLVGATSWSFSSSLLAVLDTATASVASYGASTATTVKDTDGYWVTAAMTAPITSATVDSSTDAILATTTTGGLTLTAPHLNNVSSGGSLTISDLNVDLANKRVYATLIGSNGVGTLSNYYLFDIGSITGATTMGAGPGAYIMQMNSLSITAGGFNVFAQSLFSMPLGTNALKGVNDFGTIGMTVRNNVLNDGPGILPEPSTYALMGLGLVGMVFATKRRQAG